MKKAIILTLVLSILSPLVVFGAVQIVKSYKSWEFMAQIENTKYGNLFIYKIDDTDNPNVKCYVMVSDGSKYGDSPTMSCTQVK